MRATYKPGVIHSFVPKRSLHEILKNWTKKMLASVHQGWLSIRVGSLSGIVDEWIHLHSQVTTGHTTAGSVISRESIYCQVVTLHKGPHFVHHSFSYA